MSSDSKSALVFRIAMLVVLAFAVCCTCVMVADAATHKVKYYWGEAIHYGGYGSSGRDTHRFFVYDPDYEDGKPKVFGYCANPPKDWLNGRGEYYPTRKLSAASTPLKDLDSVAMILYYSPDGPGYKKSMYPTKYYDGTDMDKAGTNATHGSSKSKNDMRRACVHLMISWYGFKNYNEVADECTASFMKWFARECMGDATFMSKAGLSGTNPDSTYYKMKAAWDQLPDQTKQDYANSCYIIDPADKKSSDPTNVQMFIYAYPEGSDAGSIGIRKQSSIPSVTDDNACYSRAGAVYGIYSDSACTQLVDTLETDEDGEDVARNLGVGTYYVKETKASAGFGLDTAVHTVNVSENKTAWVTSSEPPAMDPLSAVVYKVDAITGNRPQGGGTLAGAEFTVSYYDGYYEANALPATAKRTWVIKIDAFGTASLDAAHLVAGDVLYVDGSFYVAPLGTISIKETKAPQGYSLRNTLGDSPQTFVFQIRQTAEGSAETLAVPMNYSGDTVSVGNMPLVREYPIMGDLELYKSDYDVTMMRIAPEIGYGYDLGDSDTYPEGNAELAGAVFEVVNDNDTAVRSPQTGQDVPKGGVVCTITTDAKGHASTREASLNGWTKPSGWPGALVYGKYVVREKTPPKGYRLNENWRGTAFVSRDGELVEVRGDPKII